MNRLIRFAIAFVLPFFCLLISVSQANIEMGVNYLTFSSSVATTAPASPFADYTYDNIYDILYAYRINPENNLDSFNTLCSYIDQQGYCMVYYEIPHDNYYFICLIAEKGFGEVGVSYSDTKFRVGFQTNTNVEACFVMNYVEKRFLKLNSYDDSFYLDKIFSSTNNSKNGFPTLKYSNVNIKSLNYSIILNNGHLSWDGTYLYEHVEEEYNPSPTLPTNSEIAQAVQSFYNSDFYKNNKDFKDFFVTYTHETNYFSFIGHNHGINLGQVIVPADYDYEGSIYDQQWWKFFLRNIGSQISSNLWNKYFWLYSTNDFGNTFSYDGKGRMSDLLDLHFSTSSIIVYSTTDYPVVKIETNEETGVLEPVEGTIPGNQFTYDETLDPTENEYNPLKDFVPTDPTENIFGNVDFSEINKAFEDNKNILNIENASWLFSANNQFINYFIGFLSLLIVLLIISRILGG